MKEKILIVEDQFIEANDLRATLEGAGYPVTGIARSVSQAMIELERKFPDIVLIDIFLKGELTGIDLAKILAERKIPFIYLSANSNQSTLEDAKATQPYGFLVKPYREKDLLTTLEIAIYRHSYQQESRLRQEDWLKGLLLSIQQRKADPAEKLLLLAKAIQPFIHFDYIVADTDLSSRTAQLMSGYQRINYDEYTPFDTITGEDTFLFIKNLITSRQLLSAAEQVTCFDTSMFERKRNSDKLCGFLYQKFDVRSSLVMVAGKVGQRRGSLSFYSKQDNAYTKEQTDLLKSLYGGLEALINNIRSLLLEKDHLRRPSVPSLISDLPPAFAGIVGKNPGLLAALDQAMQVAPFDTSVLISGETGSGKEGIVNAIHQLSSRRAQPLIKINCAAIPEHLVESEFFGHEKGAFTGATERRIGKFEQAIGGTIFLDEIGEIPHDVQTKLLRVLQEKEIERLGGRRTITTDVRIIVATNRNLYQEVIKGTFRMDLYYRINVFPVELPPLRERRDDIPLLVNYFLRQRAKAMNGTVKSLAPGVMQQLIEYDWPGNIRQLQHIIERCAISTREPVISWIDLPAHHIPVPKEIHSEPVTMQSIEAVEKAHIIAVIRSCQGKIAGKGGAAEILQIPVTTLRFKMKKFGIHWEYSFDHE